MPMLGRADSSRSAVLESEHSDAACVVGHDHSICIQVGANRAASATRIRPQSPVLTLAGSVHGRVFELPSAAPERGHQPRGPPLA